MKLFGFHPPQERVEPRFWTAEKNPININAGKLARNVVLDGMSCGDSGLVPSWMKTRDAVHPLVATTHADGNIISSYGAVAASANLATAIPMFRHWNTSWWSPGGNGIGSWVSVKLPEPTLVESYGVGTNAASTPLSWLLQGSMDGVVWANLHTVDNTGAWDATYEFKEFTVPEETRGVYLYYKLNITASNATTMSIRNFRLFRPASVCAKGQLLIDASAIAPLLLSYADGFNTEDGTPKDILESVSAPIAVNMFRDSVNSILRYSSSTATQRANIYAVRNASGNISIEAEDACGTDIIQAEGGMVSQSDKGWTCNSTNKFFYNYFGQTTSGGDSSTWYKTARWLIDNADGIYATKIYINCYRASLYTVEMDDALALVATIDSTGGVTLPINRRIKGVQCSVNSTSNFSGLRLYSTSAPIYRIVNGLLYSQSAPDMAWLPCHKIRLGSCSLNMVNKEVADPYPYAAFDIKALVNDNPDTDITG